MCFDDGTGLWAPAETFLVQTNKTYYLRVKTSTATTLSVSGQSYNPPNNTCAGAFPIDGNGRSDNNACHKPSIEVDPSQLCAFSLENTAFYQYYVANNGVTIINISSIACDNGATNNNNGFQIGFFTGSCSSLTPFYCNSGAGSFVQATTPSLTAGTRVVVAIDGVSGSNCQYTISAFNAYSVLAINFRNFSVWQSPLTNIVKWICVNDSSFYYEVERSEDGSHFSPIGRVQNSSNGSGEINYSFEDQSPLIRAYYRLKRIENGGRVYR